MFTTQNQKAYLKQAKFSPGKNDALIGTLTFYLTPISYGLAVEVDPHIADRLFRKVGPDQNPCQEFSTASFDKVTPPSCQMRYVLHEDLPDSGAFIPHVEFSKLRAFKPFADDPNFSLAFNVTFPVPDKETMWQLQHREKKTMLLTFEEAQLTLPIPEMASGDPKCEECEKPPRYKTLDGQRFFCTDHPRAAGEAVEVRELPAEERARYARNAADASVESESDAGADPTPPSDKKRARKPRSKKSGKKG